MNFVGYNVCVGAGKGKSRRAQSISLNGLTGLGHAFSKYPVLEEEGFRLYTDLSREEKDTWPAWGLIGDINVDPRHRGEMSIKIGLVDENNLVLQQSYSRAAYGGTSVVKMDLFGKDILAAVEAYNKAVASKQDVFGYKLRCGDNPAATEDELRAQIAAHLQETEARRNSSRYRREAELLLPKIVEELKKGGPTDDDLLKGSGFALQTGAESQVTTP